jgi:excisionase family DNA binding protein
MARFQREALASVTAPVAEPSMTVKEVAALFRVDPKTVRRWVAAGEFTEIRTPGGGIRLRREEVRARLSGSRAHVEETPK